MGQLTLERIEANSYLVGKVFEFRNKIPSPCSLCYTHLTCEEKCLDYRKWFANDGKNLKFNRYGQEKKYI